MAAKNTTNIKKVRKTCDAGFTGNHKHLTWPFRCSDPRRV